MIKLLDDSALVGTVGGVQAPAPAPKPTICEAIAQAVKSIKTFLASLCKKPVQTAQY